MRLDAVDLSGAEIATPLVRELRAGTRRASGPVVLSEAAQRIALYVITALAEIVGCYLPYLYLKEGRSPWLLAPAAASLALFAWLLSLHPAAAGRTYAAYGGVYIAVALAWLWAVEKQAPTRWDALGVAVCIVGMLIIVLAPRP